MLKIRKFLQYRKCIRCGKEFLSFEVEEFNRKKECICSNCRDVEDYLTRNFTTRGKKTEMSFSFEFETSRRSSELYELYKYGFIACYDGSISGSEWKSAIFNNRKSFHYVCRQIDKFKQYVGSNCGTHLHVGTQYKDKIRQYENELFKPILQIMISNPGTTRKFWGRYFGHYCTQYISNYRYNSFNTRSSVNTLEFRLLKFRNANQYIKACDFCIWMTRYINYHIKKDSFNTAKAIKVGEFIKEKYKEVAGINVQISINEQTG